MIFLFFAVHLSVSLCQPYYSNHWAVKIHGGVEQAKIVASRYGFEFVYEIIPGYYSFKHRSIRKRSVQSSHHHHSKLLNDEQVEWAEQQIVKKRVKRDFSQNDFNDPLWPRMWYMSSRNGNDMRVLDVYRRYNITGRGIHVSILDDGLEKDHPDLKNNYDPGSSFDVNDNDDDPQPVYDASDDNRHGTRCAGEVAAEANNDICSVGIAYGAGIGGVRMLDGDVTDSVESKSLGLNPQHIDIYSVSWGPEDNGKTVDGPGPTTRKAIFDGITKGRNKLGNIFVWASGNGGLKGDSCACDGYTNLIYTLSISSASENGGVPWYSEPCASTLASTYSSGSEGEDKIITTDIRRRCTTDHTGTSASAPLAAGICALVLEANPRLTWRGMQYVVFLTAREANLVAKDWVVNGAGRKVSHHFGYGLMDATAMVEAALNWSPLPDHHRCQSLIRNLNNLEIPMNGMGRSTIVTDGCRNIASFSVQFLEHVECTVTLQAKRRGEVEIFLTSPMGTKSQLLIKRSADSTSQGFNNWTFMTTHCWGEDPTGEWILEVKNHGTTSQLIQWSLAFYGVAARPAVYDKYLTDASAHHTETNQQADLSHHNTSRSPWTKKKDMVCNESQFIHNDSCVEMCPFSYFGEDMQCLPCAPGCSHCTSLDYCIQKLDVDEGDPTWLASHSVSIMISVAATAISIVVAATLVFFLHNRYRNRNYKGLADGSNRHSNNNRLIHRNTYHSNGSKDAYILPVDAIKEPLLVDGDVVVSSGDEEDSRSYSEP